MSDIAKVAIVGAGGLGKETRVMIHQLNAVDRQWELIGFFDDGIARGTSVSGSPVLGGVDQLHEVEEPLAVVLAVGDPQLKRTLVARIRNPHIYFPTLVHPLATLGENIKTGVGCLITAGCRLTVDIVLGDFVMLNLNTTIGHDVTIGSFGSVMPGVHLSGYVKVGEEVLIGTGASILQGVSIGHQAVVGAGAVVNRPVEGRQTVAGVPARLIRARHEGA